MSSPQTANVLSEKGNCSGAPDNAPCSRGAGTTKNRMAATDAISLARRAGNVYNVFRENRRLLFRKGLGKRRDTGVHYESYLLGATHEVTGSCTLIECGNNRGLVDCGMEQGKDIFENQKLPVAAGEIDFVLFDPRAHRPLRQSAAAFQKRVRRPHLRHTRDVQSLPHHAA